MVEMNITDLAPREYAQSNCIALSAADDQRWAGAMTLPPHAPLPLKPRGRNDIFIVHGSLVEHGGTHAQGSFLRRRSGAPMRAGEHGAQLFAYHDDQGGAVEDITVATRDRAWQTGGAQGMRVSTLARQPERLLLVAWEAGTRIDWHTHPRGEEIFVLDGELCDQHGRYRAGTWLRLPAGVGHAPYTVTTTLTLIRTGHLRTPNGLAVAGI